MPKHHALILSSFCHCAGVLFALLWLVPAFAPAAYAQISVGPSRPLITQSINEGNLVVLAGNTRPEAKNPANDRGVVPDGLPLEHMILQLRRPVAQEQALATLINQLHDPQSPNFHHWLSASEIGAQFGPAASDIQIIIGWLQQHGGDGQYGSMPTKWRSTISAAAGASPHGLSHPDPLSQRERRQWFAQ